LAQTMDDMVFQCNNQNSIYVLNASYSAYGDFSTYAATTREINGSRSRVANPIEATCSSGVVQHKFKTFGNSKATAAAVASASASVEAATTTSGAGAAGIGTGTAAESASNYVNPVATSMSTAMCSPATAALQKLFNCSVGGACQNVTHTQALGSHNNNHSSSSSNSNNNGSHNNSCLSATGIGGGGGGGQNGRNQHHNRSRCGESLEGAASGPASGSAGATTAGGLPPLLAKKKCTNVKSALIAKKTKFLKYLEEEKWRSNAAAAPEDAGTVSNWAEPPPPSRNNNGGNLKNQSISREQAGGAGTANGNGCSSGRGMGTASASGSGSGSEQRQLNKLNNWSMHNEDNIALTTTQQQRLYQEAADILGLSCSLCDNCRCLDCQSGYFDCDDDDESYSEQSLMDDEFEYDEYEYDCSVEELQAMLTAGGGGSGSIEGQNWNWNSPTRNPCCQLDTHLQLQPDNGESHPVNTQKQPEQEPDPEPGSESESGSVGHRVAIDFDLINATCSQVLENCETFNDLSLLDAAAAAGAERPFT
ncbi:hypothetical protein KR067_010808, partial [Drosophila pandora]